MLRSFHSVWNWLMKLFRIQGCCTFAAAISFIRVLMEEDRKGN